MILEWLPMVWFAVTVTVLASAIYRPLLYLTIPLALATSLYSSNVIQQHLGFPTSDISDLQHPWRYMAHWGTGPAYVVAMREGATHPRLYWLEELPPDGEEALNDMADKTAQGIGQQGRFFDGELEIYDLDPAKVMGPKE